MMRRNTWNPASARDLQQAFRNLPDAWLARGSGSAGAVSATAPAHRGRVVRARLR